MAAKYAYDVAKVTKAATIHDGSLYADKLQQVFAEDFKKLGGTITAQTAVDPNQTDMSSVLADIAAGKPEMIYFPIFQPAGPLIIQQARQNADPERRPADGCGWPVLAGCYQGRRRLCRRLPRLQPVGYRC